MIQDIKQLYGKRLGASDGDIGHVKDFYFDDRSWVIRYLIVDTGNWLSGRQVLLTPHAFGPESFGLTAVEPGVMRVNLTRRQIEDSPAIETRLPVSRQNEIDFHKFYGWPGYWQEDVVMGGTPFAVDLGVPEDRLRAGGDVRPNDPHLRSTRAITGYHVRATDGPVGEVSGFMLDGRTWRIREVIIEAGHWYSEKKVSLLPGSITRIRDDESTLDVTLSREDIRQTAKNDVAQVGAGRP